MLSGSVLKNALKDVANSDDFAAKLADAIVKNLEVKVTVIIPAGAVTVGAGLASAPSPAPIPCNVTVVVQ